MDFVVFSEIFIDDIALEAMECINSKDQDEWVYDKEHNNPEFWWFIV